MQSLLEQTQQIVNLAAAMNRAPEPCSGCTADRLCVWHRYQHIHARTITRRQWATMRTEQRQRDYEREQQERDIENFREQNGYAMPYSMRLAAGYADAEGDE